jgi:AcrR family transcriptional regulator
VTDLTAPRRLSPDARRRQLLSVARDAIAEDGVAALTPELVAERAGVSGRLTRHYFGTRDGLIEAVLRVLVDELFEIFFDPDRSEGLATRFVRYLDFIEAVPWAHKLWTHGLSDQGWFDELVGDARRRLAELSFQREWDGLSPAERLTALGWIAFVESVITNWLAGDIASREDVITAVLDVGQRLGVPGPPPRT